MTSIEDLVADEKKSPEQRVFFGRSVREGRQWKLPERPTQEYVVAPVQSAFATGRTEKLKGMGQLSPFLLRDEQDRIVENVWQFSKVYPRVPRQNQARYGKVVWTHEEEEHVDEDGNILPEYWKWREKGMNHSKAVRYPVGKRNSHTCLYSLDDDGNKYGYIEARKHIYMKEYMKALVNHGKFQALRRFSRHRPVIITEPDGPHASVEDREYYVEKYNRMDLFEEDGTIRCTPQNVRLLLHDTKFPFGHGYVVGMALCGIGLQDVCDGENCEDCRRAGNVVDAVESAGTTTTE